MQNSFRFVSNGHPRVEGKTLPASCALCDRPFTDDDQAARVQAKYEAQELAQAENFDRQLHEREERARNEATAAAQAASRPPGRSSSSRLQHTCC